MFKNDKMRSVTQI